jgi:hypothetical protein
MRGKVYRVHLTEDEKKRLEEIVSKGVHPARQVRRAHILLLLNEEEGKPVTEQSETGDRCARPRPRPFPAGSVEAC